MSRTVRLPYGDAVGVIDDKAFFEVGGYLYGSLKPYDYNVKDCRVMSEYTTEVYTFTQVYSRDLMRW